jgi:hypothetical protein
LLHLPHRLLLPRLGVSSPLDTGWASNMTLRPGHMTGPSELEAQAAAALPSLLDACWWCSSGVSPRVGHWKRNVDTWHPDVRALTLSFSLKKTPKLNILPLVSSQNHLSSLASPVKVAFNAVLSSFS